MAAFDTVSVFVRLLELMDSLSRLDEMTDLTVGEALVLVLEALLLIVTDGTCCFPWLLAAEGIEVAPG